MSRLETPLTKLTGINYPIVQSPLGSGTSPALVAATCNAGILGFHNITWRDAETIPGFLQQTADLTSKPFGVNFVLEWNPSERLAIALDYGIRFVSFFWGDASPWISRCHDAGALVFVTVASLEDARRAANAGADLIVAQGWEAGGHVHGEVSTMALVPQVVDSVSPLPVLAAGGIGDGRAVAAALALGAAGVWMGTRFLFAAENSLHPSYLNALLSAKAEDTVYTDIFDRGWQNSPARVIRNSTWVNWSNKHEGDLNRRPDADDIIAYHQNGEALQRYADDMPMAGMSGSVEPLPLYAGQGVGLTNRVQPAAEIVAQLVQETIAAQQRLSVICGE